MFVMGTAGHVDHGKSSLVIALSGIDPDRLPEEKERGLTIDLGFAWMTTNSGQAVGIVDVPGHERFVKNMIAGVGAIDFVLFVVAADDGWMPQSSEHLSILEFLNVKRGLIAVTKKGLVEAEWLQLVLDDVRQKVSDTFLQDSPILAIDSLSGDGLDDLKNAIDDVVAKLPAPLDIGKPRMYIDRAFSISGRGAVVTGTLTGGAIKTGQNLSIVPGDIRARVREMQVHGAVVDAAAPGQRVAINLAGVEKSDLHRGQCLVDENDTEVFDRIWAKVEILPGITHPLQAERSVLVMIGTAEPEGIAYPIDPQVIPSGASGYTELRLTEPIKVRLGDHLVLRWPTPQVTIGGGTVLDIGGSRKWRKLPGFVDHLRTREAGTLASYRQTELRREVFQKRSGFLHNAPFSVEQLAAELYSASNAGEVLLTNSFAFSSAAVREVRVRLLTLLESIHTDRPHSPGVNLAQLKAMLEVPNDPLVELLREFESEGVLRRTGEAYHLPSHTANLPEDWSSEAESLWQVLSSAKFQPPPRNELEAVSENARAIVAFWVAQGRVLSIGDGVVLPAATFDTVRTRVREHLSNADSLSAAELRDLLGTTRKYAVPILEALDREGLTRRVGDVRVLADKL